MHCYNMDNNHYAFKDLSSNLNHKNYKACAITNPRCQYHSTISCDECILLSQAIKTKNYYRKKGMIMNEENT